MNKQTVVYPYDRILSMVKTKEPLTHATTWMNLKNTLKEIRHNDCTPCGGIRMKCSEKMSSNARLGVEWGISHGQLSVISWGSLEDGNVLKLGSDAGELFSQFTKNYCTLGWILWYVNYTSRSFKITDSHISSYACWSILKQIILSLTADLQS